MKVYAKLMKARIELQGRKLTKSGHNKFAGYMYFELGDFLPAVNEIFAGLGLCSVVSYGKEMATLTITDIEDGSQVTLTSPMAEANLKGCHPIQNLGAVETYTRRYLYVTALEIVEHDALDATTGKDEPKSAKSVTKDEWDKLEPVAQKWLQSIVDCVRLELEGKGAAAAIALLEEQGLEDHHKISAWGRFTSSERSAMKKASEAMKKDKEAA